MIATASMVGGEMIFKNAALPYGQTAPAKNSTKITLAVN